MFTVCPKCTLTLAVTANDLRVGQGYVRCGRCSNVFNALLKLSEAPVDGAGAELPELAQADPASTSQIHRAITAAAIDAGAGTASTAAARAAPRAPNAPSAPATSRGPAPAQSTAAASAAAASAAAPRAAPPAPAAPAAPATRTAPAPAPASRGPATAGAVSPAPARPLPPASSAPSPPAAGPGDLAAGLPRPRPAPSSPAPAPSQPVRKPTAPAASVDAATASPSAPTSPPPAAMRAAGAATAPAATAAAPAAAAPMTAATAARPAAKPPPARAAESNPAPRPSAALPNEPGAKEGDADALDQFELVLQTLGLNADGEEPPLRATGLMAEPTQTVENIVLEGDEVRQSEARVPDKPLDELDLFTRRLGMVTGDMPGAAAGDSTAPDAERPMGRLAARRARMAGRRSTDGASSGDAALAVARAAGRDPGIAAMEAAQLEAEESTADAAGSSDFDIPALRAAPSMQQRLWLAGTVALLVLLLIQFVNHWRDALAASPTWGHPVTGLYAALGVPLQPRWDLSAYEVHQQGAESAGGPHAAIRVRFSLANHAMRAQPVPLLRLTLLDRYGRRVAERDLTPADYWPKGRSMQSFLAADERVDTEVQVRDPSADSASFELDVCLPSGRSGIHCAGDVAAAGAAGVPP